MNNMDKRNTDEIWGKAILRGKDVKKMLQELSDKIELMQEDHNDLVESYRKLKDEKFEISFSSKDLDDVSKKLDDISTKLGNVSDKNSFKKTGDSAKEASKGVDKLNQNGVMVSSKTSCCPIMTPSKLVYALTKDKGRASSSIRISLSYLTTKEEADEFINIFVSQLPDFLQKSLTKSGTMA